MIELLRVNTVLGYAALAYVVSAVSTLGVFAFWIWHGYRKGSNK